MASLREKSLSTKMLILLEISTGHYSQLSPIAEKIGITKQAVSDYLKKMREEGLVLIMNGEHRASVKGVELLHSQLLELNEFLDKKIQRLNIIENCAAIAGNEIQKGEKVGLLKIVTYRPFPKEAIRKALEKVSCVGVIDKNISLGSGGAVYTEIKSLFGKDKKVSGFDREQCDNEGRPVNFED